MGEAAQSKITYVWDSAYVLILRNYLPVSFFCVTPKTCMEQLIDCGGDLGVGRGPHLSGACCMGRADT